MPSKPTLLLIVCLVVILAGIAVSLPARLKDKMVSPFTGIIHFSLTSAPATPIPSPTPKTFQFNQSTDLNSQLDSINPQVLDSDFE